MDKVLPRTNNFVGKKNRTYLSTLLTGYHYYQRIFKEEREIKNIIMDNLIEAIKQLKKEKNAIILGHYYQKGEIQDIADYVCLLYTSPSPRDRG